MAQYFSQCKALSSKSSTPKRKKNTDPIIFNNMEKLNGIITNKVSQIYKGKYDIVSYTKNIKCEVKHIETMKIIEGVQLGRKNKEIQD